MANRILRLVCFLIFSLKSIVVLLNEWFLHMENRTQACMKYCRSAGAKEYL